MMLRFRLAVAECRAVTFRVLRLVSRGFEYGHPVRRRATGAYVRALHAAFDVELDYINWLEARGR